MTPRWRWAALAAWVWAVAWTERAVLAPPVARARAEDLLATHAALFRDTPRPSGSVEADAARTRIAAALTDAGCPVTHHAAWSCDGGVCADTVNLWCRIGGAPAPGGAVVGLAHTDSVPAGPGAADDGAGVVAWVDTVRRLAGKDLRRPLIVALTDGEELGLLGARALFRDRPWNEPVAAVVNLEARGTTGEAPLFEVVGAPAAWGPRYGAFAAWPSANALYPWVYARMPNDTDLTVVREAGLPGVNHAFLGGLPRYHTPLDDRAHLDPRSLARLADLAYGWVEALGELPAEGAVVYADVLRVGLVSWPLAASVPAALAVAVGWGVVAGVDLRRRTAHLRGVGVAWIALVGAIALGVGGAQALGAGLEALAGPVGWGSPWPLRVALGATVAAPLAAVGGVADPVSRWHAVVGSLCGLGLALTVVDPTLSVVLLPATVAALGLRFAGWRVPGVWLAGLGPVVCASALPLARGLDDALTLAVPALPALPLAVGLAAFTPALPPRSWRISLASAVAAVGAAGVAAVSPAFTAACPRPTALRFDEVPDGSAAQLSVRTFGFEGADLRVTIPWTSTSLPSPTWDGLTLHLAPTPGAAVRIETDVAVTVGGVHPNSTTVTFVPRGPFDLGFTATPRRLAVTELRPWLPPEIDRAAFAGAHSVPAHTGDVWAIPVRVDLPLGLPPR